MRLDFTPMLLIGGELGKSTMKQVCHFGNRDFKNLEMGTGIVELSLFWLRVFKS